MLTEERGGKDAGRKRGRLRKTEVSPKKKATIFYPWILTMLIYVSHLIV